MEGSQAISSPGGPEQTGATLKLEQVEWRTGYPQTPPPNTRAWWYIENIDIFNAFLYKV